MMTMLALLVALQAPCVPDCPTSRAHLQSVDHTQGKACPSCGRPYLMEKVTKKHGRQLLCDNEGCGYVESAEEAAS